MQHDNASCFISGLATKPSRRKRLLAIGKHDYAALVFVFALLSQMLTCESLRAVGNDGFQSIVNPNDLKGWIVEGTSAFEKDGKQQPIWTISNGEVHCAGQGFGYLRYDKRLKDFSVDLEVKTGPNVNTGVGLRGIPYVTGDLKSRPSMAGFEVQILDDAGQTPTTSSSGSLYRYTPALKSAIKKAGDWNRIEITCQGTKILVTLNGKKVQDFDQTSNPTTSHKPLDGYLSLQNHGGDATFRNIRLKQLD